MKKLPLHTLISTALAQHQIGMYTANVGHIVSFNESTQRAQIQPGIQRVDIDKSIHDPPPINDVPVLFLGGSGHLEFEVNPGDEGLIVHLQRNIDGWKQTGGIAVNPTPRIMQMQDAVFIHGVRSLPQAIQGFANDGIRMRHGDNFVWIKNDGTIISSNEKVSVTLDNDGTVTTVNDNATHVVNADGSFKVSNNGGFIELKADGTVQINGFTIPPVGQGDASYDGTLKANDMEAVNDVKAGNISLNSHDHGGVEPGGGNTGGPQ